MHNRLVLSMSTIPDSVIELNSLFNKGLFNIGRTKRQIDGYLVDENENTIQPKTLCHTEDYLLYLCRGEIDPQKTVDTIINSSYEMKVSEYNSMKADASSEWYVNAENMI